MEFELIELSLEEKGMTQKQLASEVGVIPFRVNDYIIARYIQLSFLDFAQDENVHKWEFSARKRAYRS